MTAEHQRRALQEKLERVQRDHARAAWTLSNADIDDLPAITRTLDQTRAELQALEEPSLVVTNQVHPRTPWALIDLHERVGHDIALLVSTGYWIRGHLRTIRDVPEVPSSEDDTVAPPQLVLDCEIDCKEYEVRVAAQHVRFVLP